MLLLYKRVYSPSHTKTTAFKREEHGFKFLNSFDTGEVLSTISPVGYDVINVSLRLLVDVLASTGIAIITGAADPVTAVLTWIGSEIIQSRQKPLIEVFFDSVGLCGGMSWTSLDRYYSQKPITTQEKPPKKGDSLFKELVDRQVDSLKGEKLIEKLDCWRKKSKDEALSDTCNQEWEELKKNLDIGYPTSLCLVRTASAELWLNHQVVATGYELGKVKYLNLFTDKLERISDYIKIFIYDPNLESTSKIFLDPSGKYIFQTSGPELRGFFVWPYDGTKKVITEPEAITEPEVTIEPSVTDSDSEYLLLFGMPHT